MMTGHYRANEDLRLEQKVVELITQGVASLTHIWLDLPQKDFIDSLKRSAEIAPGLFKSIKSLRVFGTEYSREPLEPLKNREALGSLWTLVQSCDGLERLDLAYHTYYGQTQATWMAKGDSLASVRWLALGDDCSLRACEW
jgi:hypothetical protein